MEQAPFPKELGTTSDSNASSSQDNRRRELVAATQRVIASHGLSGTTSARVAKEAGLSPGIVNFYFSGKERLLLAALEDASYTFISTIKKATERSYPDPGAALQGMMEAVLDPALMSVERIAVWYAFWGEASARPDYLAVCGARDEAYYAALEEACAAVADTVPPGLTRPAHESIAWSLAGLLELIWQSLLAPNSSPSRREGHRLVKGFLASVFPWRFEMPDAPVSQKPDESELPLTLPGWTYDNADFALLEKERLFLRAWHVMGHVSELRNPGDYLTFEGNGERAFVIRGKDGELRAFHNVCRHRAHAVVTGEGGNCGKVIRCPYHGWVFSLEGKLKAMAAEGSFPDIDRERFGLIEIEMEVFLGFVFFRFESGEPGVAERFAPYAEEMALYRSEEMQPIGASWRETYPVDWKNQMDNYLEGYHVPVGHPGLYDLFGARYDNAPAPGGVARAVHWIRKDDQEVAGWSTRHYRKILPEVAHLPADRQRAWSYYALFPYVAIDLYPDQVDFFHVVPEGPGRSRLRARAYALPDARREMRAARYLNNRINTKVQDEDSDLILSVQEGLAGGAYSMGLLSEKEATLQAFHDHVRQRIPEAKQAAAPSAGADMQARAWALAPRAAEEKG